MAQAVILHTIEDVKHCLKHGLHKDAKLFSANVNVVYYLRYHCGMECEDMRSSITVEEFLDVQKSAFQATQLLLNEIDHLIDPTLNEQLNLNIRYFQPLYSFIGARQLCCYVLFARSFTRILERHHINELFIYEGILGPLNSSIETFFSQVFPNVPFLIVYKDTKSEETGIVFQGIAFDEIEDLVIRHEKERTNTNGLEKGIILFEALNKLEFFPESLDKASQLVFSPLTQIDISQQYQLSSDVLPPSNSLKSTQFVKEEIEKLLIVLYEAIKSDFCNNLIQYLRILYSYRKIHESLVVQTAYWETPPYQGASALLLEYLMTNKVTRVIGAQSVSTFWVGSLMLPFVKELVFSRCHYFLTQGATQKAMDTLYSGHARGVKIISPQVVEAIKPTIFSSDRKLVDVAIYLTSTSSFLQTGHVSTHVSKQEVLLNFLDSKKEKHINIIVNDNPLYENLALLSMVRTMKNVTLIMATCLEDYLAKYVPHLFILDVFLPSWETILQEDIDIILMQDDMAHFGDEALSLIEKRVYYVKEVEDAKQLLNEYFDGSLQKKRDDDYNATYCNIAGLKEKVSQLCGVAH